MKQRIPDRTVIIPYDQWKDFEFRMAKIQELRDDAWNANKPYRIVVKHERGGRIVHDVVSFRGRGQWPRR